LSLVTAVVIFAFSSSDPKHSCLMSGHSVTIVVTDVAIFSFV